MKRLLFIIRKVFRSNGFHVFISIIKIFIAIVVLTPFLFFDSLFGKKTRSSELTDYLITKEEAKKMGLDINLISQVTGVPSFYGLKGYNQNQEPVLVNGILVKEDLPDFLKIKDKLALNGYQIFRVDIKSSEYGILKSKNKFKPLAVMHTNGYNFNVKPEDIVNLLRAWDKIYGIDIWAAGLDFVEFSFNKKPHKGMMDEINRICPEYLLTEEIKAKEKVFLWWD